MDYDRSNIPQGYDRARDHGPEFLQLWMNVVSAQVDISGTHTILDLGCGTGRFSSALAERFHARVVGIDPSSKMLSNAQSRVNPGHVDYIMGQAESIPLAGGSVDLVFISMVFHHFEDSALAARECTRVLRDRGRLCLRAGSSDQIPAYPYVPFFPTSIPLLERRLPSVALMSDVFETAGLRKRFSSIVVQQIAASYAAFAEKLSFGGDSVLASIDEKDFQAGLDAVRKKHLALGTDVAIVEPIDFVVFEKRE